MEYTYDYFISYAHNDDAPMEDQKPGIVSQFYQKIIENKELAELFKRTPQVFLDQITLRGMDDWDSRIREAIAGARFFIVMVSENYFNSDACNKEFEQWFSSDPQRQLVNESVASIQVEKKIPGLFYDKQNPNAKLNPNFYKKHSKLIDKIRRYQSPDKFDLSNLNSSISNYAKIDVALQELCIQCAKRVYKQDAAGRSPLGGRYPGHNKNFVGRRENLDKLRKDLATAQVAALSAVNGLGGIGKTALALTYGHAFAWDYELGRAFVPCEGQTSLRSAILSANLDELINWTRLEGNEEKQYKQFWQILKNKHAEIVKRNKAEGRDPNLGAHLYLILDNVTSSDIVSEDELAQLPDFVHAVATTRESLDQFSNIEGQTLDALSEEEALELLDNLRPFKADSDDREAALEIVKLLGGFAFAVEIVGSYLRQKKFESYRNYADRLRADLLKVLDETTLTKGLKLKDHQVELVENVLAPTLAALSENARNLLTVASLFSPDAIPIPWLGEMLQLDDADEGLFELENFGLLAPLDATQKGEIWNATLARLHRLVREQIRSMLPLEFCDIVKQVILNKSKKTLTNDIDAFFQPGADWNLTAIFEFYLESLPNRQDSLPSKIEWGLVATLGVLGELLQQLGRFTQARKAFSEGRTVCECYAAVFPDNSEILRILSVFYSEISDLELAEGNTKEALEYRQHALEIQQSLKNNGQALLELSMSLNSLGAFEHMKGNTQKEYEHYQDALEIADRLSKVASPSDVRVQRVLSTTLENLGNWEFTNGSIEKAYEYYQDKQKFIRNLMEKESADVPTLRDWSVSCSKLGDCKLKEDKAEEALKHYQEALKISRRLADDLPENIHIRHDLVISYYKYGGALTAKNDFFAAQDNFLLALELAKRNFERTSESVQFRQDLVVVYHCLGAVETALGNVKVAEMYFQKAAELEGK